MFKKIFILISAFFVFFIFSFSPVLAQTSANQPATTSSGVVSLSNPLGTNSIPTLIGRVIDSVLGIVGSLALIMFVYGGLIWMTAAGNDQSVSKGKNILMWATIGLVVIFSSYALVKFVIQAIGA